MSELTKLPNIGKTLADRLAEVEIVSQESFFSFSTEQIILRLSALPNHGLCANMVYAIEGAKQGVRWHYLDAKRKEELLKFLRGISE